MKTKIITKGRKEAYKASAYIDKTGVTVLAGSKLGVYKDGKLPSEAKTARKDSSLVSDKDVLLKNVTFKSISTAAGFVTGYISNGYIVWKAADGKKLPHEVKKHNKNPK